MTGRTIHQLIAELDLVSHVSAVKHGDGAASTSEDIGGRRPTGGVDRKGDREPDYRMRSADYFRRKLERTHSPWRLRLLVEEAEQALATWKRQPAHDPAKDGPAFGSPQWKRWVAETDKSVGDVARLYGVSRQYVHRIRCQYRDVA